ncbi:MAG TPA: hypothetical protein VF691_09370 [Cytophagaceae bacterium]|jgi:hypothetical protein
MASSTTEKTEILVFKTNIESENEYSKITTALEEFSIVKWNIDHEDKDNILRIVSDGTGSVDIVSAISEIGFFCEELQD